MKNIFSIHGRASRKEFLIQFVLISVFWVGLSYLLRFAGILTPDIDSYLLIKLIVEFITLMSFTPLMLRRIHDIHLPGYVLIVFWALIPFSIRNIIYWKQQFGIELNQNSWPVTILNIIGVILLLILFIYKGYSKEKRWGSPNNAFSRTRNRAG